MENITQELVKRLYRYDPITGIVFWKNSKISTLNNKRAGTHNKSNGYRELKIHNKKYKEHRVIWLWMTGNLPKEIDHKNRILTDNRWNNLRIADRKGQRGNICKQKNNTSGFRGVVLDKKSGKWIAKLGVNKQKVYLGRFNSKQKAFKVYEVAAKKYFGEFYSGKERND